jgi:hypothetical protein
MCGIRFKVCGKKDPEIHIPQEYANAVFIFLIPKKIWRLLFYAIFSDFKTSFS